jgi:hypothetical protein
MVIKEKLKNQLKQLSAGLIGQLVGEPVDLQVYKSTGSSTSRLAKYRESLVDIISRLVPLAVD